MNATISSKIEVIDAQNKVVLPNGFIEKLQKFLMSVAAKENGLNRYAKVNVILVDNKYISELNERFLGREGPTDVLAFPLDDVGEIYVSVEFGLNEVFHYALHGLLHLAGYDHKTPNDEKVMRAKEDKYLKLIL